MDARLMSLPRRWLLAILVALLAATALALPAPQAQAAYPGENGRIVYSENAELWTINPDGTDARSLQVPGRSPHWSPDGGRILYEDETGALSILVPATGQRIRLTLGHEFVDTGGWSPDGSSIVFGGGDGGTDWGVWTVNVDGAGLTRLTSATNPQFPSWSPDGQRVAYSWINGAGPGSYLVVVHTLATGAEQEVYRSVETNIGSTPSWSPDGSKLVFGVGGDAQQMLVVPSNGGTPVSFGHGINPEWSPDGTKIVAAIANERHHGHPDLVAVDAADGSNRQLITDNELTDERDPDWQPIVSDATAPALTLVTPAGGGAYVLGSNVVADYACTDEAGGTGIASCVGTVADGSPIDTATTGPKTFSVTARDNAGNTATETVTYDVVWSTAPLIGPIDPLPTFNTVSAGQGVPVKFNLGGDRGLDIIVDGYPRSESIACNSTAPVDGVEETATVGANELKYDPATGNYNYLWKTDKAWAGTCRQFVLKLIDGSVIRANFQFGK